MVLWVPVFVAAAVSVCVGVMFPRAPTWQIVDMKYRGLSMNIASIGVDMKIDMGLEVFNPNYVPATLKGIVMTMFHEDLGGEEAPFGVVTFAGENAARLPARGSAVVQAQMEVVSLPTSMAMGIAKDVADGGVIVSRASAVMDVKVMGGDILIEADCVQHMQADVFPIKINEVDCKYYYKNVRVPVLPP
ncbi:unnamed protein product [Ectocarpus sp. 6 AP-2014]